MIVYTATWEEWEEIKVKAEFRSEGYDKEGFIHCSYPKQTVGVLNKHFRNEGKVVLLIIDPNLLSSKWISEDLKNRGEEFPHIYGSINVSSIMKVIYIQPSKNGLFYENDELKNIITSDSHTSY